MNIWIPITSINKAEYSISSSFFVWGTVGGKGGLSSRDKFCSVSCFCLHLKVSIMRRDYTDGKNQQWKCWPETSVLTNVIHCACKNRSTAESISAQQTCLTKAQNISTPERMNTHFRRVLCAAAGAGDMTRASAKDCWLKSVPGGHCP